MRLRTKAGVPQPYCCNAAAVAWASTDMNSPRVNRPSIRKKGMENSAAAAGSEKTRLSAIASSIAVWAPASSLPWIESDRRGRSATPIATPTSPSGSM